MQIDVSSPSGAVWKPDEATVEGANLTRFMRALGVDSFEALNERANRDPAWFHDALIRFLDYRFERPYERVLNLGEGLPFARWCVGGVTNVVLNCIDKHRGTARYAQPALVWEGEDGAVSTWTFADLDRETCRISWGLRRLGLGRGDVVGMYLPNLPHAAVAMLAVAKIGGIVLPMFSGFGEDAIAQRLNDGRALALITVDGSLRRGKPVGAKAVVDKALAHCPDVRHVVVLSHLATRHGWTDGRDHWWHELATGAPDDVAAVSTEPMPADDPFLLMFTSGTSGRPKGVVHSHCGFPVNKPGASGNLSAGEVARAAPDGYTFLVAPTSVETANPSLFKSDLLPSRDLTPVMGVGRMQMYVVARPTLEVKDVKQLVGLAKAQPGKMSFASSGIGTPPHLAGELFKQSTGTFITHVPYRGSAPALQDVMASQADFVFDPGIAFPHIKSGKVKLLAVASDRKSPFFPEAPTYADLGLKNASLDIWFGVWAPNKVPAEITERLSRELTKALASPALKERFRKLLADEGKTLSTLIKDRKIVVE